MLKRLTIQTAATSAAIVIGAWVGAQSYLATVPTPPSRETRERFISVAVFNVGAGSLFVGTVALVISSLAVGPDQTDDEADRIAAQRYANRMLNAGRLSPEAWAELQVRGDRHD